MFARVFCGHESKDPQANRRNDEEHANGKAPCGREPNGIVL